MAVNCTGVGPLGGLLRVNETANRLWFLSEKYLSSVGKVLTCKKPLACTFFSQLYG